MHYYRVIQDGQFYLYERNYQHPSVQELMKLTSLNAEELQTPLVVNKLNRMWEEIKLTLSARGISLQKC